MRNQWEVKWWRVGLALAVLIAALWVGGFVFREWLEWKTTREYLQEKSVWIDTVGEVANPFVQR